MEEVDWLISHHRLLECSREWSPGAAALSRDMTLTFVEHRIVIPAG